MKTRGFIVIVITLTFALAAQFANTSRAAPKYSARLTSPAAGQVLYPGQVVRVEWQSVLPKLDYFDTCEMEVRLSLDGGHTYPYRIGPWMTGKTHSFYWTVLNTPTNAAVMDIRFGCEPWFPESFAPQTGSMFVIAESSGD